MFTLIVFSAVIIWILECLQDPVAKWSDHKMIIVIKWRQHISYRWFCAFSQIFLLCTFLTRKKPLSNDRLWRNISLLLRHLKHTVCQYQWWGNIIHTVYGWTLNQQGYFSGSYQLVNQIKVDWLNNSLFQSCILKQKCQLYAGSCFSNIRI